MKTFRFLRLLLPACALLLPLAARSASVADASAVVLNPSEGKLEKDTVFTASFPGPMVPASAINAENAAAPVVLQPKLEATFLWKSTTDGELTLTGSLTPGTHYRVSTAPGLKDAQGHAVPAQKWEFDTDPFEVSVEDGVSDDLSARPKIRLTANFPVSLVEAAEAVYFQDRDSHERFPAEVLIDPEQSAGEEDQFTVSPRNPLPMGRTFDVVANGLRDAHGHVPLAFMHVFPVGETTPLLLHWVEAFNNALEKPKIRCKFSEQIDPDSVGADAISLTPAVPGLKVHADGDEIVAEGAFDIAQHYVAVISPGVKGVRGFGLAAPSKWGATFHPKEPTIIFPDGEIFQRSASGLKFSLLQVNTGPLTWTLSEVPIEQLPAVAERAKKYQAGEPPLNLKVVGKGQFEANAGEEEVLREIDWHPPQPPHGAYLLEASAKDAAGQVLGNRSLVCFSELLLTRKRTESQVILRAAQMSDGLGVAKLPVRVVTKENLELARGETDANGIVAFPTEQLFPPRKPGASLFIAETPAGPAIQYVDTPEFSGNFLHSQTPPAILRTLVVTDRNLYRPGQTVKMHGIVRLEKKGVLSPSGFSEAKWKVQTEGGDPVTDGKVALSDHGTWDAEWAIPSSLATGAYEISCDAGILKGSTVEIRVEEYRVPLFSVLVNPIEEPGAVSQVKVSSTYFHGAPNARAKVHWKAVWETAIIPEGKEDGFVRTDAYSENALTNDEEKETEGEAALDDSGTVTLHCAPPFTDGKKRGRCSVSWTVDVTSAEAQTLSGGAQCRVQFANAWAGVRADSVTGVEKTIELEAQALGIDDQPVKGTPVHIDLFHVATKTVKEKIAPFVVRYRNNSEYEKVASQEAQTPAKLEIPVKQTGEYVAVVTGPGGVPSSTQAFVSGDEQAELPVENDTQITVSLPEPPRAYAPGEVAPISIQAPFGGVAWVSVEAEGILDTLFVPLAGNAGRIDLPVKKEYAPNATVTVYLVQPGGAAHLPRERLGEVRLNVARADRDLVVTPKLAAPTVKPGAPVRGELTVTSENRPVAGADFLVFAVDDAVLQLGAWKMPDAREAFYPERGHDVYTFRALSNFVEGIDRRSLLEKGYIVGDGGDQLGNVAFVRKEFKTLAYWQANLTTDAQGKIPFEFTAPDNLTSYRVIAIGQTDANQFGAGSVTFTVSKPLLCEAALPRFVRVGDEVRLRAVARQNVAKTAKITVRCVTEGFEMLDNQPITEPAAQDIPAVFNFAARVLDQSPEVKVRFEATSDIGETDAVDLTLPVHPPTVLHRETVATTVHTESFQPVEAVPKAWQDSRGSFEVTLSTSPWLPKLNGLPAILEYPHGCFEQISSRILAYAMMSDLLSSLPDGQARDANYRATITEGLKRCEDSLLADGFLPYWPGDESPHPFVTVLAAWAVREADHAGIEVSPKLSEQLGGALQKIIANSAGHADPLTRCFALFVAAGPNTPADNTNAAEDLYLKRDRLTDEARALLAIALQRSGTLPKEKAQLLKEIGKPVAERAFDPETFGSTTRAEALTTLAFAEIAPQGAQSKQRHDRLLTLMDSSASFSTEENLWLLLAFKALHDAQPPVPLKAGPLQPQPPLIAKNQTGAAWPKNDLAVLKAFKIEGLPTGAPLSCLISAEYRTLDTETVRSDRGLRVERVARDLTDPKRTGAADAPFKLGDQILVTYRVLSRNLHNYVALEDLLPAGLETVNPNLPLVAKTFQLPAEPGGHELALSHSDLRDQETCLYFDRVEPGTGIYSVLARATSAGNFHWPATQVAPMYDSRFTGLSASSPCVVSD